MSSAVRDKDDVMARIKERKERRRAPSVAEEGPPLVPAPGPPGGAGTFAWGFGLHPLKAAAAAASAPAPRTLAGTWRWLALETPAGRGSG